MNAAQLRLITDYPEEVHFVKFSDYEKWEFFEGYAYSIIGRRRIERSLGLLCREEIHTLIASEMWEDWQDAQELSDTTLVPENLKHAIRVAYLVRSIPIDGIEPVSIDTFSRSTSRTEGHHRLLALKYLGYPDFPAVLSGDPDQFPISVPLEKDPIPTPAMCFNMGKDWYRSYPVPNKYPPLHAIKEQRAWLTGVDTAGWYDDYRLLVEHGFSDVMWDRTASLAGFLQKAIKDEELVKELLALL